MDDPAQISANSLLRLVRYSEPVEWEILARAYKTGESEMSDEERKEVLNYISKGIQETLKDVSVYTSDRKFQSDIIAEVKEARIISWLTILIVTSCKFYEYLKF